MIFQGFAPLLRSAAAMLGVGLLTLWLPLAAPLAAGSHSIPHGEGRLFAVTKGEDGPVSYLFGTMHVNDARVLAVPEVVRDALSASSSLYVEVVLDEAAQQRIHRRMTLNDGRSLYDIVGEDLFYRIADRLEEVAPRGTLNRLSPIAVMNLLRQSTRQMDHSNPDAPVLDEQLQAWAKESGLKVRALEEVEEQLDVFADLSEEDLVRLIESSLEQPYVDAVASAKAVLDFYLEGDLAGLLRLSSNAEAGTGLNDVNAQVLDALIDQRNEIMVNRLLAPLSKEEVFVAVGALHLPGERGLLRLLENEGYEVTRLY